MRDTQANLAPVAKPSMEERNISAPPTEIQSLRKTMTRHATATKFAIEHGLLT
jgi:hypothetical protein